MRTVFALLGLVLVPLGVAGLVLPVLPGTPLLIAAAACFARSSPRLENYLVNHPRLGAPIRAWRESGAIPARAKIVALIAMAVSIWVIAVGEAPDMAKAAAISIMVGAAVFVATRRNS